MTERVSTVTAAPSSPPAPSAPSAHSTVQLTTTQKTVSHRFHLQCTLVLVHRPSDVCGVFISFSLIQRHLAAENLSETSERFVDVTVDHSLILPAE